MKISKRALDAINCNEKDYIRWCNENKKSKSNIKSMKEFCYKIETNKLIRNNDGNLISVKEVKYDV